MGAIAGVILLTGCGAQPRHSTPVTAGSPGSCTLTPTNGLKKVTITAPGPGGPAMQRTYELYVPAVVNQTARLPLLVSLHGTGANGAIQASLTHWTSFGESVIAAFPDGAATLWLWGTESSYDVKFIFDVVKSLQATGCVEPSAVYVDGWSEGAYMAQRMACASPDANGIAFAAVHGYAGGNPQVAGAACDRPAPTRILLSQGLEDTIIDPAKVAFPGFKAWGARYSCAAPVASLNLPQNLDGCASGAQVAWWPISGQGHLVWSCASDPTWHNRGVWAFFTQHQAPASSTCS